MAPPRKKIDETKKATSTCRDPTKPIEEDVRPVGPVRRSCSSLVPVMSFSDITFTIELKPYSYFDDIYALDFLKYYQNKENNISGQRIIRQNSRSSLINWLINVNMNMGSKYNPALVQLSSWYLDWYTTTTEVAMDKLKVTAAAGYLIAAKSHGQQNITIAELVKYANNAFTEKELLEDERNLFRNMGYHSLKVTPHDFVPYLSSRCDQTGSGVVEAAATFLCQCGVMVNQHFYDEYPSAIAAGAVKTALLLLGHSTGPMQELSASIIYKKSVKKARNLNRICYDLREAVRLVSSEGFRHIAPLNKFSGPPHFITKKIVEAVNDKMIVSFDARNK